MLFSSTKLYIWSFHVVVWERTVKKAYQNAKRICAACRAKAIVFKRCHSRRPHPCLRSLIANNESGNSVDSETFYKKLDEVKATKKRKASKLTLFIDDNFYNDAVKWLESSNENNTDNTNLTCQDIAIIKRKEWKLEGGKIICSNRKEVVQKCRLHQVLCLAHSSIAHKGRDKTEK